MAIAWRASGNASAMPLELLAPNDINYVARAHLTRYPDFKPHTQCF